MINASPESFRLDYDEASSLWPGHVTIRNLQIRGSDQNVQWIIRLASARVDYSVLALAQRTFRAERLRGTGLSFAIRNKIEPAAAKTADASVLPPVPGFVDPPLRGEEPPDTAPGNPWRVDVQAIAIDHFDEIWFDAFHFRGAGHLEGRFFLRPGLLARIGPARVSIESGEVRIGHAPEGVSVSGTIAAAFEPFEPPKVQGSAVWQKATAEVKLDTGFERLQAFQHLVAAAGTKLEEGVGKGTIAGTIDHGIATGEVRLAMKDGAVRLNKLKLQGDADARLKIPRWDLASGPLEFSGSQLAVKDVRSSGSDESRRWWGRFDLPSGKMDSTVSAKVEAKARDARPLLALFAVDLPSWTRGLVNLDDLSARAAVDLGPSLIRVRGLDARGGSFHIQGHYRREKASREGAFLIESGALEVGLSLEPDATKVRLLGARRWFEELPKVGSKRQSGPGQSEARETPRPAP